MLDDDVVRRLAIAARVDHAASDLLHGQRVGNRKLRIDGPQRIVGKPPRNAVQHRNDLRASSDQRFHRRCDLGQGRRLYGDHDDVLRAETRRIFGRPDRDAACVAAIGDEQPAAVDGVKRLAACDHRDVITRERQPRGNPAAHRARSDNANVHGRAMG
jgi:hypothetical protein